MPHDRADRTIATLKSLSQFEIDVIKAYERALTHIADDHVRDEVYRIKADNERHVLEMGEILRAMREEPPHYARDVRGYLMACVAALRSADGSEGALRAIRAIGEAAIERYDQALAEELPVELRGSLEAARADIVRHIDALDGMLVHVGGEAGQHSPPGEPI